MSPEGNRLSTARLLLEPVRAEDVSALHTHWTAPEVRRFLWDGRTVSADEVRDVVHTSGQLFREHGVGLWAVRPGDRSPDADPIIGCAGFWFFHEPPELELLLSLSPDRWGQGLALECAGALFDLAFARLGWDAVQASADAPNEASLKLMRRLGMRRAGERPGFFGPILVFRIGRAEWLSGPDAAPP